MILQEVFSIPSLQCVSLEASKEAHPIAQISTGFPCPLWLRTSGATYPKLPASDVSCSSEESRCFALQSRHGCQFR
jgi:hypothetical protein